MSRLSPIHRGPKPASHEETVLHFWARVKCGPGCWEWQGAVYPVTGYGQCRVARKQQGAHRVAWWLTNGEIPPGMSVCHRCDNRLCCNPEHLFLGTHRDNMRDAARKGRMPGARPGRKPSQPAETCYLSKLTRADVVLIRFLRSIGARNIDVADWFGITPQHVCKIKSGAHWKETA